MSPIGRHHRFVTAAAVALAVTAGAAPATPALAAIPAAAAAESTAQEVLTVPPGTTATSGGATGYLTYRREGTGYVFHWTQYEGGVRTQLPGTKYGRSLGTDIVVRAEGTIRTFIDMSTGQELVSYDLAALGDGYTVVRYQGTTLVATTPATGDRREIHLISKDDQGRIVDRTVAGAPADAVWGPTENSEPGTFLAGYSTTVDGVQQHKLAVVDVASASVVETYDTLGTATTSSMSLSRTHVAWAEVDADGNPVLAMARRGTSEVTRTGPLGTQGAGVALRIVGDWVVYSRLGGNSSRDTDPLHQVTARSLTHPDETFPLLANADVLTPSADGGLIVTGGTIEQGQGLYRIVPGEDGRPAATLLATNGVSTVLAVAQETPLPSGVVDFDRASNSLTAAWTFNRPAVDTRLEIVHTASGRNWRRTQGYYGQVAPNIYSYTWNGTFDPADLPAYNGAYTWTMTAKPQNGIGPDVVRTGSFTTTDPPTCSSTTTRAASPRSTAVTRSLPTLSGSSHCLSAAAGTATARSSHRATWAVLHTPTSSPATRAAPRGSTSAPAIPRRRWHPASASTPAGRSTT